VMRGDGKGRGSECDGRKKRDLQINSASTSLKPGADVAQMCPVPAQMRYG
jgi:hypothetical protein